MNQKTNYWLSQSLHCLGITAAAGLTHHDSIFLIGYHSISDPANADELHASLYPDLTLGATEFEAQLQYLIKHNHTLTDFAHLSETVAAGASKPTVIFFDDGFRDNILNAAPLLKKYHAPATFFLTSGYLDHTHAALTIEYRYLLQLDGKNESETEQGIAEFKKMAYHERAQAIAKLREKFPSAKTWEQLPIFMSWDEARELRAAGFEIGAHGLSHTKLTECHDETLAAEVQISKEKIEKELGEKITTFSYPHGRFNDEAVAALSGAGYKYAVSTNQGAVSRRDLQQSPLALKKITPRVHETKAEFASRLYLRTWLQ